MVTVEVLLTGEVVDVGESGNFSVLPDAYRYPFWASKGAYSFRKRLRLGQRVELVRVTRSLWGKTWQTETRVRLAS
jgi:hypothetical protein